MQKNPGCLIFLSIADERGLLTQSETQSASCLSLTRLTDSIANNDNRRIKCAFFQHQSKDKSSDFI